MSAILHIDSSARINGSLSRELSSYLAKQLAQGEKKIVHRDLATTELPLVTEAHIGAYYTPKEQRSTEQQTLLGISDTLIAELKAANTLVIGAPIYNFSVPAVLKAWIDLVCRVGETFVYESTGPKGLLTIDQAYIVVAAGGTAVGSDIEQAHIIDVSGSKRDPETLIDFGKQQIHSLVAEAATA